MEILGDLVEPVHWGRAQRDEFEDRWKAAKQVGEDAAGDGYGLTRRMLQQQYARQADKAGNSVRPVVAFLSEEELKQSIQPGIQEKADRLGIVFKQEFFLPGQQHPISYGSIALCGRTGAGPRVHQGTQGSERFAGGYDCKRLYR